MKSYTGSFPTWLTAVATADLWTFATAQGNTYRWTSWESSLTRQAITWTGTGTDGTPLIKRQGTRIVAGLEVDSLTCTVLCGETVQLGNLPFVQAATAKLLDGCDVTLERAYMGVPGTIQSTVNLFKGTVSEVRPSHSEVQLTVKSFLERLNQNWPRNYWSPICQHKLYGAGCGVSEAAYQSTGGVSGDQFGFTLATGKPSGYFNLGKCTFISGQLAGMSVGIKEHVGSQFTIMGKLPFPAAGNVVLVPGCDKVYTTCRTKFSNTSRFKGEPFIPKPETAR